MEGDLRRSAAYLLVASLPPCRLLVRLMSGEIGAELSDENRVFVRGENALASFGSASAAEVSLSVTCLRSERSVAWVHAC